MAKKIARRSNKSSSVFPYLILAFLILIASFFLGTKITKNKSGNKTVEQYQVSFTRSASIAPEGKDLKVVGYAALDPQVVPPSYLAIYEIKGKTSAEVYRYAPVVPAQVGYPNPLQLEKIWLYSPENGETKIVSSWGETGANYFGTHPVVTTYKDGKFRSTDFYEGNMAEREEIKGFSWTQKDFLAENYFDNSEKSKTILCQGIDAENGSLDLSFFGDNNCHACEHNIVKLQYPL